MAGVSPAPRWRAAAAAAAAAALGAADRVAPLLRAGSAAEDPLAVAGAVALAHLPETGELAVGTFGAGLWALGLEPTPGTRRRALLPAGERATSLELLPGGCLAVGGGAGVLLLNVSSPLAAGDVGALKGTMLLEVPGVNAMLALPPATGDGDGGHLAVASDEGLFVVDTPALCQVGRQPSAANGSSGRPPPLPALGARFAYDILRLSDGRFAVGTDGGVWLFDDLRSPAPPSAVLVPKAHVTCLAPLPGGGLAAGSLDGALLLAPDALRPGGRPRATLARGSAVWAIHALPSGALLVGTSSWAAGSSDRGALLYAPAAWRDAAGGRQEPAPAAVLSEGAVVWALAAPPPGAVVAVGGSAGVELFDLGRLEGAAPDAPRATM